MQGRRSWFAALYIVQTIDRELSKLISLSSKRTHLLFGLNSQPDVKHTGHEPHWWALALSPAGTAAREPVAAGG